MSTDARIAANIDRGFCPKNRSAAVVPSRRVSRKLHIPPDLVVDQLASDGESSSNRAFLFLHDVWAMFRRQIYEKITSTISMA